MLSSSAVIEDASSSLTSAWRLNFLPLGRARADAAGGDDENDRDDKPHDGSLSHGQPGYS
jgi:hypothetical protein